MKLFWSNYTKTDQSQTRRTRWPVKPSVRDVWPERFNWRLRDNMTQAKRYGPDEWKYLSQTVEDPDGY